MTGSVIVFQYSNDWAQEDSPRLCCLWCAHGEILRSHSKCRTAAVAVVSDWAVFMFCMSLHTSVLVCTRRWVHMCEQGKWWWGEVSFIGGSFNIFSLWSESQHTSAQCHKGDFDGKERGRGKKWSGFGSKHWISFQAWTLHWAFQQMSKSLLVVDRQPNGPQQWECGRDMKEVETKG